MVWNDVEHTFCDIEPFSQAILKKHWPNAQIYGDIRTLTADAECVRRNGRELEREGIQGNSPCREAGTSDKSAEVYILTGGFPCQPFSQAGRRRGTEDDRHLWPEMLRVIREFNPRWVVGENVGGLATWSDGLVLEQIHLDLEGEGYEVQSFIIPAVSLNAPHRRDRVWIVARNTDSNGRAGGYEKINAAKGGQQAQRDAARRHSSGVSVAANTEHQSEGNPKPRRNEKRASNRTAGPNRHGFYKGGNWTENWPEVAAQLCTLDDGLPNGLARPRGWRNAALKGAGNAIVPQVAAEIMRAIKQTDDQLHQL